MEQKNREQRRREKFGRAGKVSQHDPVGPWPDSEANPALRNAAADQAAEDDSPDQDETPAKADPPPEPEAAKKPGTKPKS